MLKVKLVLDGIRLLMRVEVIVFKFMVDKVILENIDYVNEIEEFLIEILRS